MKSSLRFVGNDKVIFVEDHKKSILDHAINERLAHLHECGGNGMCTTCRIRVLFGAEHLTPPTEAEHKYRESRAWQKNIRLACQTYITGGDVLVERLLNSSAEISSLQTEYIPVGIGEEQNLAVLFCDMRNFTPLSEQQTNFDMAHILNRFFTSMGDAILMNNGIIYQYVGDEIIALFGISETEEEQACINAVRAGLTMTYAVERLNKWDLKHFDARVDIGIGIHFGKVFIGNVGHPQHKQFAVIGDTMNVTSRIQNINRQLGTRLLASDQLFKQIPDGVIEVGKISNVELKGKSQKFMLHEITGFENLDSNLEVQATIDILLEDEEGFASDFYKRLFKKMPSVEALFDTDMKRQGMQLSHMLRGIVFALSRPDNLVSGLRRLGSQHRDFGVQPEHYTLVSEVLKDVVSDRLGEEFNEQRRKAWGDTIDFIITEMQK